MKVYANTIPIWFLLSLFFCWGCSDADPPALPAKESRVVKAIVKPSPEEPKSAPNVGEKEAESKVKAEEGAEAGVGASKPRNPGQSEEVEKRVEGGYYAVRKGDSLSSIAAREDVCGDSLKWLILLRLNMNELGNQPLGVDLPHRELPSGLKLKIPSPEEMKLNRKRRSGKAWTVNIKSTAAQEKIVPAAITLTKEGYPVYLSRVNVKGKDWVRLRVGFFEKRAEADAVGKEIQKILNIGDTWSSKAGKNELEEFGGF